MNGLLQTLPTEHRRLLRAARPGVELAARPMLATLSDRRDFPDGGIFERKLDGVRLLAGREGGRDIEAPGVSVTYYIFALLGVGGTDVPRLPLRPRKSLRRRALPSRPPLR